MAETWAMGLLRRLTARGGGKLTAEGRSPIAHRGHLQLKEAGGGPCEKAGVRQLELVVAHLTGVGRRDKEKGERKPRKKERERETWKKGRNATEEGRMECQ